MGVLQLAPTLPILVFQHMAADHPGYLFDLLDADNIPWRVVRLDLGELPPDLGGFSALWVLGGPMDVWEERDHPWLIEEKRAIREAVVDRAMPYFGVCLGHQLLAAALGGEVGPAARPEMGVFDVTINQHGQRHPLLAGLPSRLPLLQWHLAEVKRAPAGAKVLASSAHCPIHGITFGNHALGLQSHIEVSLATVREWLASSRAMTQLENHLGADAPQRFEKEATAHLADFNQAAKLLYGRLIASIGVG